MSFGRSRDCQACFWIRFSPVDLLALPVVIRMHSHSHTRSCGGLLATPIWAVESSDSKVRCGWRQASSNHSSGKGALIRTTDHPNLGYHVAACSHSLLRDALLLSDGNRLQQVNSEARHAKSLLFDTVGMVDRLCVVLPLSNQHPNLGWCCGAHFSVRLIIPIWVFCCDSLCVCWSLFSVRVIGRWRSTPG